MPDQNVAVLSFERVQSTAVVTTLETEYRKSVDPTNGNKHKTEQFLTLDPLCASQVNTITIALGVVNDDYAVVITSGTDVLTYRHRQIAGDTANSIANFLAKIIDTSSYVQATSNAAVITITGAVPGAAFDVDNTTSTTPANLVIAETTPPAGTPKHRKRWEIIYTFSIKPNGFETVSCEGACYDGANPGTVIQRFGPLALADAPRSLSQIQTEQGVSG